MNLRNYDNNLVKYCKIEVYLLDHMEGTLAPSKGRRIIKNHLFSSIDFACLGQAVTQLQHNSLAYVREELFIKGSDTWVLNYYLTAILDIPSVQTHNCP